MFTAWSWTDDKKSEISHYQCKACKHEYMSDVHGPKLCPVCNEINYMKWIQNEKQNDHVHAVKEEVTHMRMINGEQVAVTNKGNVKDIKSTRFYNDPKGHKHTGMAARTSTYDPRKRKYSELTRKAKNLPTRSDFPEL